MLPYIYIYMYMDHISTCLNKNLMPSRHTCIEFVKSLLYGQWYFCFQQALCYYNLKKMTNSLTYSYIYISYKWTNINLFLNTQAVTRPPVPGEDYINKVFNALSHIMCSHVTILYFNIACIYNYNTVSIAMRSYVNYIALCS